jgi:glycosyltransferase involved in cell wall biosynthesis
VRIIQVVNRFPPSIGGAENYVFNVSRMLQQLGHEVLVLTSDLLRDDTWIRLPKTYENAEIEDIPVKRFRAFRFIPGHGSGVVVPGVFNALLHEYKADVLHTYSYGFYSSYAPTIAGRIRGIPVVFTTFLSATGVMPGIIRRIYDNTMGEFTLRSSACIVAVTNKEKAELQRLGVPKSKIRVIAPGIDVENFSKVSSSETQEFRENTNRDGKIVLFVGRLGRNKGIEKLVAAVPLVTSRVPNTKFLIIGDDWGMRKRLEILSHELNVSDFVIFGGKLSQHNLAKAYVGSDLFVFPSLSAEAYGLVLLEAMAARKPIVAFRGMTPEILQEGKNCLLAAYGDHVSLSDAIANLLLNPNLSRSMGNINRQIAAEYSWESVAKHLVAIYQRAVKSEERS